MGLILENENDVIAVLQLIDKRRETLPYKANAHLVEILEKEVIDLRKIVAENSKMLNQWGYEFLTLGAITLHILEIRLRRLFDKQKFAKFLMEKHRRYGGAPLMAWKEIGILMRVDSKVARIINLIDDEELGDNEESIEDTLQDIIGYCVLGYRLEDRSNEH